MKALVLLSGGVDSTTAVAKAIQDYDSDDVAAISFRYGQTHEKELEASKHIAEHYGIAHYIQPLDFIADLSPRSSLVEQNHLSLPQKSYAELAETTGPSPTYVNFRNGIFLSVAAAKAMVLGAGEVWCGIHAEDARGWAYPDCTPEFAGGMAGAIWAGTYGEVRLVAPFLAAAKADIIMEGYQLDVPYRLTWSCYMGMTTPCHQCPACVSRDHAFDVATDRMEGLSRATFPMS